MNSENTENIEIIDTSPTLADKETEKKALFADCVKLSLSLILYNFFNKVFTAVFFYAAYAYHSGKFTLSYTTAVTYLRKQTAFVSSTAFNMTANLSITLMSFIVFAILFRCLFKSRAKSYLHAESKGAVVGLKWFSACFVVNLLLSQFVSMLTNLLGQRGVSVPSTDFSIRHPSVAAIILQLGYVVIIAPIIEECIYRGAVLTALAPYGQSTAVLFSALAFGLMHGNIPQAASAFATGFVYAIIAVKCGSVLPTIIIHCLNNLLANFSTLASAAGIKNYSTALSIAEIVIGLFGCLVLFVSLKKLALDDSGKALSPKETRKAVFTNPAAIIYLLCLIYPIAKSLVLANVG